MVSLRDYPRCCCGLSGALQALFAVLQLNTFFATGFCSVVKRVRPALQRLLEDHRDHYKHPRPAERGRSAISLGPLAKRGAERDRGGQTRTE